MHGRAARTGGGAVLIALVALCLGAPTTRAAISCHMNVVASVPSPYAATYVNSMTVDVRSKEGRTLSGLRASLYTFRGRELATGTERGRVGGLGSAKVTMKLAYPMQAGKLSVVVSELRNASCGTPKRSSVLTFRGCPGSLPARLTRFSALEPGLSDFSDVIGATGGAFLQGLDSRVYDPLGQLVGETTLDVLFGRETLDHPLSEPLEAGGTYTQIITGRPDNLPGACPTPSLTATLAVPAA